MARRSGFAPVRVTASQSSTLGSLIPALFPLCSLVDDITSATQLTASLPLTDHRLLGLACLLKISQAPGKSEEAWLEQIEILDASFTKCPFVAHRRSACNCLALAA